MTASLTIACIFIQYISAYATDFDLGATSYNQSNYYICKKITIMQHIIDRFISYVTIDTESDPNSTTTPSTAKQWDLANKLVEELKEIGLKDVTIDDKSYIQATL